jgi:cysteine desulfurase/selenocysteine lyase
VYLDSAATSQKPTVVIDAIADYYKNHNANVHRGVHTLGDESTKAFHESRKKIASFFGASADQLIVSDNATASFNHLARWWQSNAQEGEAILATEMEHHSNLVPWQVAVEKANAKLEIAPIKMPGILDVEALEQLLQKQTYQVVALTHVSNSLGTLNDLSTIIQDIRKYSKNAWIIIDGTQGASHLPINIEKLGVDAYIVSAHKMLGPMGIGGMIVSSRLLAQLQPFNYGGGMIDEVTTHTTTYIDNKEELFTAGTPDVAGLVAWSVACDYLSAIGMDKVAEHDKELTQYAITKLQDIPFVEVLGPLNVNERVGSVTFLFKEVHSHDVGQVLDSLGIAVRSGHHCTMPLHTKFNWTATTRASFSVYTSSEDVDRLVEGLYKVAEIFGVEA